jgi:tetratricopeptide (TPR) repeat protein
MYYKVIIQGCLKFGNQKSYDKVVKMFQYRSENYYKMDTIIKEEDVFNEDDFSLTVVRFVGQSTEKSFKNAVNLLEYCAQFAVAGNISIWLTDKGIIRGHESIEPESDKVVVQQFLRGKKLTHQVGKEKEAIEALTQVIEKYDKHAQAYEIRARVNLIMKKYHDAMRDYNKCIAIDDSIPQAYYGRAKVNLINNDLDAAIIDLELAIKKAVALQAVYWKARRLKAECHIEQKQFNQAEFDLKLFTNRKFDSNNPNFKWRRSAYFNYGKVLLELEKFNDALEAFEKCLDIAEGADSISEATKLMYRGIAKKKTGKSGFIKDLKQAADLGNKSAESLLKSYA